jgi:hypothetical protein
MDLNKEMSLPGKMVLFCSSVTRRSFSIPHGRLFISSPATLRETGDVGLEKLGTGQTGKNTSERPLPSPVG